jgi:hypothetical protein
MRAPNWRELPRKSAPGWSLRALTGIRGFANGSSAE